MFAPGKTNTGEIDPDFDKYEGLEGVEFRPWDVTDAFYDLLKTEGITVLVFPVGKSSIFFLCSVTLIISGAAAEALCPKLNKLMPIGSKQTSAINKLTNLLK
jgi:hypothetical protein